MNVQSDEDLMLAVGRGDHGALEEIVLRHQADAWRVAYRFTGDAVEAEDLAQEAFLRILAAAPRYRPTARFRTFLYRILNRLCLDHVRRKRPALTDSLAETPDDSPSPLRSASRAERETAVQSALNALPAAQRIAVVLRYFEGLSGLEMAEAMGRGAKAIERLLSRARAALKPRLRGLIED